jgi:hypothetical protein
MIKITDDFECTLEGFQGVQKQYADRDDFNINPGMTKTTFFVVVYALNQKITVYSSKQFITHESFKALREERVINDEVNNKEIAELEIEYDKCKIECDNAWNRIISEYNREKGGLSKNDLNIIIDLFDSIVEHPDEPLGVRKSFDIDRLSKKFYNMRKKEG